MAKELKDLTKSDENYSQWYNDLVVKAGLAENSAVRGCMVIKPYGYAIWEKMHDALDKMFKDTGHQNAYFPLFIPKSFFSKEAHHVEGFAKECAVVTHYRLKNDPEGKGVVVDPDAKLEEELIVRPTSETIIWNTYKNWIQSYRDLPKRYGETSTLFRNENSGEMHGLIRVRQFTISEGHLMCTPAQLEQEFKGCLELARYCLKCVGLDKDVSYRFSRWDPRNPDNKYIDDPKQWAYAEGEMKRILDDLQVPYTEAIDEAAFYGPKLDIQIKNVHGKEDTLVTIQVDMFLAERFDMYYIDENGEKARPYIIHRTSMGCYERTIALLLEKYAGAMPTWLAPEQVRVLSLTDRTASVAEEVRHTLFKRGFRAETDVRNEKVGYKIREAQLDKIPYMIIIGDKEAADNVVAVRSRKDGDLGTMTLDEFMAKIQKEVDDHVCE